MAKTTTTVTSEQAQFATACNNLRYALDRQAHPSVGPSLNVRWAILHVLAFDPEWRTDLGSAIAAALRAEFGAGTAGDTE